MKYSTFGLYIRNESFTYHFFLPYFIGCYHIPKTNVLLKLQAAKEAQRKLAKAADKIEQERQTELELAETLIDFHGSTEANYQAEKDSNPVTPIEKMTVSRVFQLSYTSLEDHLDAYGVSNIPRNRKRRQKLLKKLVQKNLDRQSKDEGLDTDVTDASAVLENMQFDRQSSGALDQFAEIACSFLHLSRRVVEDAKQIVEVAWEHDLPPYRTKFNHMKYDLNATDAFPRELFRLLEDAESLVIGHIISWQENEKSFIVHDRESFESKVLAHCCDESEDTYDDFVKILLCFGFSEIETGKRKGGYRHEFFRRSKPNFLSLINPVEEDSVDEVEEEEEEKIEEEDEKQPKIRVKKQEEEKQPKNIVKKPIGIKKYNLSKHADFLLQLHRLLDNAEADGYEKVIRWLPDGKAFAITDEKKFLEEVLRKQSKCPKISSFEALLFDFGFTKIRRTGQVRRYNHPHFLKGRPERLSQIKTTQNLATHRGRGRPKRNLSPQPHSQEKKQRVATSTSGDNIDQPNFPEQSLDPAYEEESPSEFVQKLRSMLDSSGSPSAILEWLPNGLGFTISNPGVFESETLSR
jgi:hypothetical protein